MSDYKISEDEFGFWVLHSSKAAHGPYRSKAEAESAKGLLIKIDRLESQIDELPKPKNPRDKQQIRRYVAESDQLIRKKDQEIECFRLEKIEPVLALKNDAYKKLKAGKNIFSKVYLWLMHDGDHNRHSAEYAEKQAILNKMRSERAELLRRLLHENKVISEANRIHKAEIDGIKDYADSKKPLEEEIKALKEEMPEPLPFPPSNGPKLEYK